MTTMVVGAGLAKLMAAAELSGADDEIVVVKAKPRVGGRMLGIEVAPGEWINAGAAYLKERHTQLNDLLERLGGHPAHAMSEAVVRESRAIEQVIRTKPDGAGPLPMVYAMLSAELMDAEGWNLLLELADALDGAPAVRELRKRAEHESEHLELIRHLALTLAKRAVEFHETDAETQLSGLGRSSGRRRVVTASRRRAQAGSGR